MKFIMNFHEDKKEIEFLTLKLDEINIKFENGKKFKKSKNTL
jgi:hypothetical protein